MTLLDRVLAHTAATKRREFARLNTPIHYAGPNGDEYQHRNVRELDDDVDMLLLISPYLDRETGRLIRCLADIDAAPAT
ncbi:hypothetical protein OHZ10_02080 [Burkholderia arboris]|uniref:Uncharacterized protein n=1 Tax=Burkholderia arboris TaxID=488730 RepID=A0ABZ3DH46_9BURK